MVEAKAVDLAHQLLSIFLDFKRKQGESILLATLCSYWTQKKGTFYELSRGLRYAERQDWLKQTGAGYFLTAKGFKQAGANARLSAGKSNPQLFGHNPESRPLEA